MEQQKRKRGRPPLINKNNPYQQSNKNNNNKVVEEVKGKEEKKCDLLCPFCSKKLQWDNYRFVYLELRGNLAPISQYSTKDCASQYFENKDSNSDFIINCKFQDE